jgi:GNAT superfamily N-acetyltransferase
MMNLREAHAKDHAFLVEAQIAMALETEGFKLDPHMVELGVGAVLLDPAKGVYYVAETKDAGAQDSHPIGCLLTVPEWSDWRNGTVLWIHSLYVQPKHRKNGVFKALYAHLKNKVNESKDLRGLRLYVDRRNSNAQRAYENSGMTKEHYEMFEWLKS